LVIESVHKGVEIELELHQFQHGWKCDFTLIKHPEGTKTVHLGDEEFATMELARESALQAARAAIDRAQATENVKPA
jgi:hypothetical protein